MREFQKRLKQIMDEKGLRQADLVKASGISRSVISSYVSGRYEPNPEKLKALARALSCDAIWLAGYDGIEEDKEKALLEVFRTLNAADQEMALAFVQFLHDRA